MLESQISAFSRLRLLPISFLVLLMVIGGPVSAQSPTAIKTHENQVPSGTLKDGVLALHLVVGEGTWYPEAEGQEPSFEVLAFGEEGGPLMNPGPLIRVPEGTELSMSVRNQFAKKVYVHGLHGRPGDPKDFLSLEPGEVREVKFKSGSAGTYSYWASLQDGPIVRRGSLDSQLSGAFIVDPSGAAIQDRVFIIGYWRENLESGKFFKGSKQVIVTNGKSWPWSEHLQCRVGEEIRWRWLNTTGFPHPMHLHGAYFHVDSAGDGEKDTLYSLAEQRMEVTESMAPGATMTMIWSPEKEGQWLFHCHLLFHIARHSTLGYQISSLEHSMDASDPGAGMSGLVLGIKVLPGSVANSARQEKPKKRPRQMILDLSRQAELVHIALREGSKVIAETQGAMGPPLILTRGQPVEITVRNGLPDPTSIHWHGIELESYYDGVPGWDRDQHGVAPAIAPGQSFVVKMTPPRAGTFIYHTHWHDAEQLTSGLYGPLIVLEPDQKYNPATDKVFLVSRGGSDFINSPILINGTSDMPISRLSAGRHYRFRFINICPEELRLSIALTMAGKPVQWLAIAKDGADLPPQQATMREAIFNLAVGETYDFDFQPGAKATLTLEAKGETQSRTEILGVQ